jgi:hypothetical protein
MFYIRKRLLAATVSCGALLLWTYIPVGADAPGRTPVKLLTPKPSAAPHITSVTPAYGTDNAVIVRGNLRLDKASAVVWGGQKSTAFSVRSDGSLSAVPVMPFWGSGAGPWTVPVTVMLGNTLLPTTALFSAPVGAVNVSVPEPAQAPYGGPEYVDTFWQSGGGHSFLLGPVAGTQLVTDPTKATFYVDTIVSNSDLPFSQKLGDGGEGASFLATLYMCDVGNDVATQLKNGASRCKNWDGYHGAWAQATCAKVSWSGKFTQGAEYPYLIYLDKTGSSKFASSKQERFTFNTAHCFDGENLARTFYYNVKTAVLQRKWFPFPGRLASQNSPTFNIVVGPAAFLQTNVIPYSILFQPPGDQSTVSFTAAKTYGTQFSIAQSKGIDNKSSTSQSSSLNFAESFAFILGFGGGSGSQTTQTTLQDFGTVAGNGTQGSSSAAFNLTHSLGPATNLVPGSGVLCNATATSVCASTSQTPNLYANEPFWNDEFFLIIRPQFAIWVIGGKADRYQLYGAVPVIGELSVAELAACESGNTLKWGDINPCEVSTSGADLTANNRAIVQRGEKITVTISAADARNLLKLDPFYAGGQGADISPSRGNLIYSGQYGAMAGLNPSAVVANWSNTTQAQLNKNGQVNYGTSITNTTGSSSSIGLSVSLSLGSQEGATNKSLGGYAGSGQSVGGSESLTIGSQNQTSTENDTTLTYQNSTAVSKQTVTTASVTLNDESNCPTTSPPSPPCHGPLQTQPSVNVYFDRVFGGFMFQDPYAPKASARERVAACCAMLIRAIVAREQRNQRFVDVPPSKADAGRIGLLARAGVLPGYADGTFRPNQPFTREQLAAAIQRAGHLSSSGVDNALTGVPVGGSITEAELAGAFARAGLSARGLPDSNIPLTRATAADWLFQALVGR